MNDDKIINDMAELMSDCSNCKKVDFCSRSCSSFVLNRIRAIILFRAGYSKIPNDVVFLNKQEYQDFCAYKLIEPQIKGCLDREREYLKQLEEIKKIIHSK